MLAELSKVDPECAARLHPRDEKRIIRALEVFLSTGKTMTQHNLETQAVPPRYDALTIGLSFQEREDMWKRIDRRVDEMMSAGLVEEVRALLARGVPQGCTALQAIGYKEMVQAVLEDGDVLAAAEEVKLRSRQYAKRQLTWFRRNPAMHWLYPDETAAEAAEQGGDLLSLLCQKTVACYLSDQNKAKE